MLKVIETIKWHAHVSCNKIKELLNPSNAVTRVCRVYNRALPPWDSQSTKGAFLRAGPQCFSRRVIGSQRKAIRAGIRGEIREHRLAFISKVSGDGAISVWPVQNTKQALALSLSFSSVLTFEKEDLLGRRPEVITASPTKLRRQTVPPFERRLCATIL